mmetsp:Transcript_25606/g.39305  ORF Transcript_25606/g.39305 Transcript_25606/m.39305 type:complete len:104 (-) Transcript_25606:111-422(-)
MTIWLGSLSLYGIDAPRPARLEDQWFEKMKNKQDTIGLLQESRKSSTTTKSRTTSPSQLMIMNRKFYRTTVLLNLLNSKSETQSHKKRNPIQSTCLLIKEVHL